MFHLSEVQSASDVISKILRTARLKSAMCVITAALASLLLTMPAGTYAQSQTQAEAEPIQVENQVDINTADAETLALALDGVGMAKAHDIIAYREQNGEFKTVDDLQKVSGIGKATLERNRSRILVQPSDE